MKKSLYLSAALLSFLAFFCSSPLKATAAENCIRENKKAELSIGQFLDSSNDEIEKFIGKKLSWGEKIALKIFKKRIKKELKKEQASLNRSFLNGVVGCSKIVLKNGDIIEADISQITPTEVKYKRCGKPNDPEIILSKKDILSVTAEDGVVIFRNTGSQQGGRSNYADGEQNVDGLAIASLITGLSGLLIGFFLSALVGVIIGVLGVVLGAIALARIKRNPDKYRGKGMAWTGIITGVVMIGLFIWFVIEEGF